MHTYKPRRNSARWLDGDCPEGVLAIYDHPSFTDRYTVFYVEPVADGWFGYRSMSASPCSPQGVGLWCEMQSHQLRAYRQRSSKRKATWSSLPDEVKALVRRDLED